MAACTPVLIYTRYALQTALADVLTQVCLPKVRDQVEVVANPSHPTASSHPALWFVCPPMGLNQALVLPTGLHHVCWFSLGSFGAWQ